MPTKANIKLNKGDRDWISIGAAILSVVIALVLGVLAGGTWGINVSKTDDEVKVEVESEYSIELSEEQIPAVITTEEGTTETIEAPTVELIDDGEALGEGEDAQGAWHDTSSPEAYKNSTLNQCIQNAYGGQCFALANDFWQNYAGRNLSSCGTGAAKGTWNCKEQNAGNDFVLIYNANEIQAGDWIVYSNGTYGHIGMALGPNNNGYVALLGQNQGGARCSKGGAATNIINKSSRDFVGAFRPKSYVKPAPKAAPAPAKPTTDQCKAWNVKRGDTMGKIMLTCTGQIKWGVPMNEYASHWYSTKVKPGQTVLYGWTHGTGYGLYAGDVIEWR